MGGGGGGGYYATRPAPEEAAPIETTEALRRQDVEVRLGGVETDVGELKTQTKAIDTKLGNHVKEQGHVNTAQKLSGARQEMMLEQLLRARGRTPPNRATGPDVVLPEGG